MYIWIFVHILTIQVGNKLDLAEKYKKVKSVKILYFDTKKADDLYKNVNCPQNRYLWPKILMGSHII